MGSGMDYYLPTYPNDDPEQLDYQRRFNLFLRERIEATESYMILRGMELKPCDSLRVENDMLQFRLEFYRFKMLMCDVRMPLSLHQVKPERNDGVHHHNPQDHQGNMPPQHTPGFGAYSAPGPPYAPSAPPSNSFSFPGGDYHNQNFAFELQGDDKLPTPKGKKAAKRQTQTTTRKPSAPEKQTGPKRQKIQPVPLPAYSPLSSHGDASTPTNIENGFPDTGDSSVANNPDIDVAQPGSGYVPGPQDAFNPQPSPSAINPDMEVAQQAIGLLPAVQGEVTGYSAPNTNTSINNMLVPFGTEHLYPHGLFSVSEQGAGVGDLQMSTPDQVQQIDGAGQNHVTLSAPQGDIAGKGVIVDGRNNPDGALDGAGMHGGGFGSINPAPGFSNNVWDHPDPNFSQFTDEALQNANSSVPNNPTQQEVEDNGTFDMAQDYAPPFKNSMAQSFPSEGIYPTVPDSLIDPALYAPQSSFTNEAIAGPSSAFGNSNITVAGPSSAVAVPAAALSPEPVIYNLGYTTKIMKHTALARRGTFKKIPRVGPNSVSRPCRPWVFGYTCAGTKEYSLYFFSCPVQGCPEVIYKHPLMYGRAAEHLIGCGVHFHDEDDMVRNYATQRKSEILSSLSAYDGNTNIVFTVIADTDKISDGVSLLEWARDWNSKILESTHEEHLAHENFPQATVEEKSDKEWH